ncbi:MAG: hypothetical protein WGN25_12325 [Candidatus Electrothrix sp. GW3-4]|uniref:hypothetical protein n=1 Tax=Candidatus Electrothrix sp. GW3-4 TaxID=3126740 RepID=UPI0030CF8DF6
MNESADETAWEMNLRITRNEESPSEQTLLLLSHADQQSHQDRVKTAYYGQKRLVISDAASGSYQDVSLFAIMSFRSAEHWNRQSISKAIEAGGAVLHEQHVTPLMSRHDLSQGTQEHLNELKWQDDKAMAEGVVLFAASGGEWPVPGIVCQRFARYVRRCFGGHPAIIRRIATAESLPKRLEIISWFGDKQENNIIEIMQSTQASSIKLSETSMLSRDFGDDQLARCMEAAYHSGPICDADFEKNLARIRGDLEKERWFPALLGVLTLGWSHPIATIPQDVFGLVQPLSRADPTAAQCCAVLERVRQGDLDITKLTEEFQQMRQAAADRAYVLDIFLGTFLIDEEPSQAISAYLAGLQGDPRLVSPYHDLGLIFERKYNHNDAYRCWDFARWLSPNHPIMSDVEAWEHDILAVEAEAPFGQFVSI